MTVKMGSVSEGLARLEGEATWKAGEPNVKLAGRDKSHSGGAIYMIWYSLLKARSLALGVYLGEAKTTSFVSSILSAAGTGGTRMGIEHTSNSGMDTTSACPNQTQEDSLTATTCVEHSFTITS